MAESEDISKALFDDIVYVGDDKYVQADRYGTVWSIKCLCQEEQNSMKRCDHCGERL